MICERSNCQKKAKSGETECEHHCNGSITVMYSEWDTKRWEDRKELLSEAWDASTESVQQDIIGDMIIHSHDLYDQ